MKKTILDFRQQEFYSYLTRGAKNSKITKRAIKQIQSLMETVYIKSAKKYLAINKTHDHSQELNKKKLIEIGVKNICPIIFKRYIEQNYVKFKAEDKFNDPTKRCQLIINKKNTIIKNPKHWFSQEIYVDTLGEISRTIEWPKIRIDAENSSRDCRKNLTESIVNLLLNVGVSRQETVSQYNRITIQKEVNYFISKNLPIRISFYLFCGKIGNPFKAYFKKPRLADYYGLKKLAAIEKAVRSIYQPKNYPYSVEWFIVDQTKIQRFDIPPGQEKITRNVYNAFLKKLHISGFVHIIPWENLIPDIKKYEQIVNILTKEYITAYKMLTEGKRMDLKTSIRAEKIRARLKSGFTIVNPCKFPYGKMCLEDILIIYNDIFPGLHFNIKKLTSYQKQLYIWINKRSIYESADYYATLETRTLVKNFDHNLPQTIKSTITRKPGRFVLDYLGSGKREGTRFFPDVGEPVILQNGELNIIPYITILSYPKRFEPVYIKEFNINEPFFWLCKQDFKYPSKDVYFN